MKKLLLILISIICLPLLVGCGEKEEPHFEQKENDDDVSFSNKLYDFHNLTDEFDIPISKFELYFKDGSAIPYVNSSDFLYNLDGLFDCGAKLSSNKNDNKSIVYNCSSDGYSYNMMINWYENFIYFDSYSFVDLIVKDTQQTDYAAHFEYKNGYMYGSQKPVRFNLDYYNFDIFYYDGVCLVPLCIYNMILGAPNYYNVIFNGSDVYGYYGEIDDTDPNYSLIYNNNLNDTQQSQEIREASYYSLCFAMDYFYGLKEDKNFEHFNNYISGNNKNLILSKSANDNVNGYLGVLINQLDELHTRLDSGNFYCKKNYAISYPYSLLNKKYYNFYATRNKIQSLRQNRFGSSKSPAVRYVDNNAIITLDGFHTASNNELFDENKHLKSDAWLKDTYYFMDHVLKDIVNHGGINNVLFDISYNGGGNVGALIRALGFLTNNLIRYTLYDTISDCGYVYYYDVDTNGDDTYDDNDAYTQFNYAVLTSFSTYSAANTFTNSFKELGIGKVIGQKSGGGMCSIIPLVLADGTFFAISSYSGVRHYSENAFDVNFDSIEDGIDVDKVIDYQYFYDDDYLSNALHSLFLI